jgi:hypothetical protein
MLQPVRSHDSLPAVQHEHGNLGHQRILHRDRDGHGDGRCEAPRRLSCDCPYGAHQAMPHLAVGDAHSSSVSGGRTNYPSDALSEQTSAAKPSCPRSPVWAGFVQNRGQVFRATRPRTVQAPTHHGASPRFVLPLASAFPVPSPWTDSFGAGETTQSQSLEHAQRHMSYPKQSHCKRYQYGVETYCCPPYAPDHCNLKHVGDICTFNC